ncbi:MAG: hypothetical protein Q7N95_04070 [Alphaproteobacteria bacterium]|nr:hypothetical protein [Alphaproteobacteria bacterium]
MEDEPPPFSYSSGLLSEPSMYAPLEIWEKFLAEMQAIPADLLKEQIIIKAKRVIEESRQALNAARHGVRWLH